MKFLFSMLILFSSANARNIVVKNCLHRLSLELIENKKKLFSKNFLYQLKVRKKLYWAHNILHGAYYKSENKDLIKIYKSISEADPELTNEEIRKRILAINGSIRVEEGFCSKFVQFNYYGKDSRLHNLSRKKLLNDILNRESSTKEMAILIGGTQNCDANTKSNAFKAITQILTTKDIMKYDFSSTAFEFDEKYFPKN